MKSKSGSVQQSSEDITLSEEMIISLHELRPSILNKSSMNTIYRTNSMLEQLPSNIPRYTQKLDLTYNLLKEVPLKFVQIKELILNKNSIQKIPQELNQISTLKILRLNHNRVTTIPFLKYIRQLELAQNPIKLISTEIKKSCLQVLLFDWIPFLYQDYEQTLTQKNSLAPLKKLMKKCVDESFVGYLDFNSLFCCHDKKKSLNEYVYLAIVERKTFFIHYLRDFYSDINFNSMTFQKKFLLEDALIEENDEAISLFMLKQDHIENKLIFLKNLELACYFVNIELFQFLLASPNKRIILSEYQDDLIDLILRTFSKEKGSGLMLKKMIKYSRYNFYQKKRIEIPNVYSHQTQSNYAQALIQILSCDELREKFDFCFEKKNLNQPLLHFAMQSKNFQLIILVLQYTDNPFQKNKEGQLAKTVKGIPIGRKYIWKHEKRFINNRVFEKEEFSDCSKRKSWMSYVFQNQPIIYQTPEFLGINLMGISLRNKQHIMQQTQQINIVGKKNKTMIKKYLLENIRNETDVTGISQDFLINSSTIHKYKNVQAKNQSYLISEYLKKPGPVLGAFELFQAILMGSVENDYNKKEKKFIENRSPFCQIETCNDFCDDYCYEQQVNYSYRPVERRPRQITHKK